jgi:proton-dependent oligopeptide transporter, POT family
MDRHMFAAFEPVERWLVAWGVGFVAGWSRINVESAQVQAVNPLLIMVMIPLFTRILYPTINRVVRLTPLRKIGAGLALIAAAFALTGHAETLISPSFRPSIWWQVVAFTLLTAAEVMVSITCLEFSYTQSPKKMKSVVMSLNLLSVAIGNLFTACVNFFIQNRDGTSKLPGASYYWFFTILMLATTAMFVVYAMFYREKDYIQAEASAGSEK